MGLDMYMRKVPLKAAIDDFNFDDDFRNDELFYWRKHPNLHGWMEDLYRKKGGTSESFNICYVRLTEEDLNSLEQDILSNKLPETSGFFFGESRPESKYRDLEFIALARETLAKGYALYYTSWW